MDLGSPGSYLTLGEGLPVYSSDGQELGSVAHVLAEPDKDIFDGVVIDTGEGHRFVDAPHVESIHDRGVVLSLDRAAADALPEPSEHPEGELERKLRRAWDLVSGNY